MTQKLFIFCLIVVLSLAFVTGCGKKEVIPYYNPGSNENIISDYNEQVFASANLVSDRGDYLLGAGDLLEIKVLEAERLNTATRISSRGYISVPLLDEVKVGGMTAGEAEQFIEDMYSESYIKDPHVSIFVKEHFSQRITVVGQVKNPGTYDYSSRQRLLDAIALAGGLTESASRVVQVRRNESDPDEKEQTVYIDLDELINKGRTELNVGIYGRDVIYVPEAGSFFIDGAVRRPGEYHIKQSVSIEEAIITAGGYEAYADTDQVVVIRNSENGKREEVRVKIDENMRSEKPFFVENDDIIIVNASFWGKVFHGSGVNIGVPGMGVSYRPVD